MFIKLLNDQNVKYCLDNINHKTFSKGEDSAPDLEDIRVTMSLPLYQTQLGN